MRMEINVEIRKSRMRAHSAIHLITDYCIDKFGFEVVGSNVESDYCTVDFKINRGGNIKNLISELDEMVLEAIKKEIETKITLEKFEDVQGAKLKENHNYASLVRVIDIKGYSKQLCCGTHVKNTKEIIDFVIIKEFSKKSGIRRLECLTGLKATEYKNDLSNKSDDGKKNKEIVEFKVIEEFVHNDFLIT